MPVVLPDDEVICLHCQQPLTGWAAVPAGPLCHPSGLPEETSQLDCYRLVTVWGHPMPCDCSNALGRAL